MTSRLLMTAAAAALLSAAASHASTILDDFSVDQGPVTVTTPGGGYATSSYDDDANAYFWRTRIIGAALAGCLDETVEGSATVRIDDGFYSVASTGNAPSYGYLEYMFDTPFDLTVTGNAVAMLLEGLTSGQQLAFDIVVTDGASMASFYSGAGGPYADDTADVVLSSLSGDADLSAVSGILFRFGAAGTDPAVPDMRVDTLALAIPEVPAPAAGMLLLSGLGGLAALRRRRNSPAATGRA